MRIAYLSHVNSYHTIKWARHFSAQGHDVHVLTLQQPSSEAIECLSGATVHWLGFTGDVHKAEFKKALYLFAIYKIKTLIKLINPDVVHAHYASSYGLLAALCCDRPYYLSVWGSDIYDFPKRSIMHKLLITYILKRCTWLCSTSEVMAKEIKQYTDKPVLITPFGVDMRLFNPDKQNRALEDSITIGTVKALERKYGIGTLLEAVSLIHNEHPCWKINLRIAGKGSLENELKETAEKLGITGITSWLGYISQEKAAHEWANFDIGIVASEEESESFGVAAVECQACGTPLIITDIPGLKEASAGGKTSLVVPRRNHKALAHAIEYLIDNPSVRLEMGRKGRDYVRNTYEIHRCFHNIENIYIENL